MHSVNFVSKRFLIVLGLGCLALLASLALLLWAEPVFSALPVQEPASLAQVFLSTEVSGTISVDTT